MKISLVWKRLINCSLLLSPKVAKVIFLKSVQQIIETALMIRLFIVTISSMYSYIRHKTYLYLYEKLRIISIHSIAQHPCNNFTVFVEHRSQSISSKSNQYQKLHSLINIKNFTVLSIPKTSQSSQIKNFTVLLSISKTSQSYQYQNFHSSINRYQ